MANRRSSWRRAPANSQPHHRRPQKNQTTLPFSGVEDHAVLTLFTHLLAKKVNVNATNGAVYTGLFAGTQHSPNSNDLLLTLRYARLVRGKPVPTATVHDLRGNTASRILIPFSRVTTVIGVPLENKKSGFATDAQITRGSAGVGRQLQRFEDFSNVQTVDSNNPTTLDQRTFGSLANNASRQKWDQFQVNQAKFGVTTSFDESEYTTTIDRSSKDFAERQREAQRLAEEIESAPSQNMHVREERNQELGTDYDNEEARYSEVQRPQTTPQPVARPQIPSKNSAPEKPRLSYAAAAAAGGANADARQHLAVKPPSAGSTRGAASINKSAPMHVKNAPVASKASTVAGSKHSQQGGKPTQDQGTRYNQVASRASHSASGKNALANGKGGAQAGKSVNKKNSSTNKPQQNQGKNGGANNRASSQVSTNKSSTQHVNARPAAQGVNAKSNTAQNRPGQATSTRGSENPPKQLNYAAASAGNSKGASASTRPQTQTKASQENAQRSTTSKATTPTQSGNKEKISEKPKAVAGEKGNQGSSSQVPKVRGTLTGRTSPNQSRNSPLPTSTVADTSAIGVLNLDAQTPKLGPEQIKSFQEFKTKREEQMVKANRDIITHSLKKFSTQLESKNGSLRRGQNGGSSTPGTPRATSKSSRNVPDSITAEKPAEDAGNKELPSAKEETQPSDVKQEEKKSVAKSEEDTVKPRPKSKLRLNPNAQEFKLNPDAPSFTPASQKPQTPNPAPYTAYNNQPGGQVEFSQPMQVPPGYTMPIQAMTQMAYGPQSYVVVPSMPTPVGGGNPAYPFVPQPPSFGPAHVGGRFPQSTAMPVSYGYQHVTPMVMAQPPQPRVQASPYYHNAAPYGGAQAAPGHLSGHQAHLYQQGAPTHMQPGAFPMTGRGGHGNPRRGGTNRGRGKAAVQQSYPHMPNPISGERPTPKSPDGARAQDGSQR